MSKTTRHDARATSFEVLGAFDKDDSMPGSYGKAMLLNAVLVGRYRKNNAIIRRSIIMLLLLLLLLLLL